MKKETAKKLAQMYGSAAYGDIMGTLFAAASIAAKRHGPLSSAVYNLAIQNKSDWLSVSNIFLQIAEAICKTPTCSHGAEKIVTAFVTKLISLREQKNHLGLIHQRPELAKMIKKACV